MVKIYVASNIKHAALWRHIRTAKHFGDNVEFLSTWIDSDRLGNEEALYGKEWEKIWDDNFEQISHSDVLILYALKGENLRGALVEAGYALALKLPVIVVSEETGDTHSTLSSWQFHRRVWLSNSLKEVPELLSALTISS